MGEVIQAVKRMTWGNRAALAVVLVVCVVAVVLSIRDATAGLVSLALVAPLIVPKTREQLIELARPSQYGVSNAKPWILYDTQLYTSAVTTVLNFFSAQQTDRTMSNMLSGGSLPQPQFFEGFNLGVDILADTTSGATDAGALDDIQKLMLVGRPIFTITNNDENLGPFPLSFLHTSGGAVGGVASTVATASIQFGTNSNPDGGWNWRGALVIQPGTSFSVQVQYAAAQTLAGGNPNIRFWIAGAMHRGFVGA